jgi:hypothetical protein
MEIECMPGHVVYFEGETLRAPDFSSDEEKLAFALRRVCHLLIDRIDGRGLPDVCQSLVEFHQFYRPAEASPKLLPDSRTREATLVSRTTALPFAITEE